MRFDYHIYNNFFEISALCLGKILSLLKTKNDPHYWDGSILTSFLQVRTLITTSADKSSEISGWIHNVSLKGVGVKGRTRSSFGGVFQEGDEIDFRTSEDYFELNGRGRIALDLPAQRYDGN